MEKKRPDSKDLKVDVQELLGRYWASGEKQCPWQIDSVPQFINSACQEELYEDGVHQIPAIPTVDALQFARELKTPGRRVGVDNKLHTQIARFNYSCTAGEPPEIIHRWAEATRIPTAEVLRAKNADFDMLTGELGSMGNLLDSGMINIPSPIDLWSEIGKIESVAQGQIRGVPSPFRDLEYGIKDAVLYPLQKIITAVRWSLENKTIQIEDAFPILQKSYALLFKGMQIGGSTMSGAQYRMSQQLRQDFKSLLTGGSTVNGAYESNRQLDYFDVAMMLMSQIPSDESKLQMDARVTWNLVFTSVSSLSEMSEEVYMLFLISCMRMPPRQREQYEEMINLAISAFKNITPAVEPLPPSLIIHSDRTNPHNPSVRRAILTDGSTLNISYSHYSDFELTRSGQMEWRLGPGKIGKEYIDYGTGKLYRVDNDQTLRPVLQTENHSLARVQSPDYLQAIKGANEQILYPILLPEVEKVIKEIKKYGGTGSIVDITQIATFMEKILGIKVNFDHNFTGGIARMIKVINGAGTMEEGGMKNFLRELDEKEGTSDDRRSLIIRACCAAGAIPKDLLLELQISLYEAIIKLSGVQMLEYIKLKEEQRVVGVLGGLEKRKTAYDIVIELSQKLELMNREGGNTSPEFRTTLHEMTIQIATLFSLNVEFSLRFDTIWDTLSGTLHETNAHNTLWAQCNSSHEAIDACLRVLLPKCSRSKLISTYGTETMIPLYDWLRLLPNREKSGDTSHGQNVIPLDNEMLVIDGTAGGYSGFSAFIPPTQIKILPVTNHLKYGIKVELQEPAFNRKATISALTGGDALVASLASKLNNIPLMLATDPDTHSHLLQVLADKNASGTLKIGSLIKLLHIEPQAFAFCKEPKQDFVGSEEILESAMSIAVNHAHWWALLYLSDVGQKAGYYSEKFRENSKTLHSQSIILLGQLPLEEFEQGLSEWRHLIPPELEEIIINKRHALQAGEGKGQYNTHVRKVEISLGKIKLGNLTDALDFIIHPPEDNDPARGLAKTIKKEQKEAMAKGATQGGKMVQTTGHRFLIQIEEPANEAAYNALRSFLMDTDGKLLPEQDQIKIMHILSAIVMEVFGELVIKNDYPGDRLNVLFARQAQFLLENLNKNARAIGVAQSALPSVPEFGTIPQLDLF